MLLASAIALNACADTPQRDYEKSIKDAAVRGPGWDVPLTPLPQGRLTVSTFTDDMALDIETIYTWVAPAQELRQRCTAKPRAKRDTVFALEQILGLPPLKNPKPGHEWRVYVFDIEARDLFRPCPGGLDPAAPLSVDGHGVDLRLGSGVKDAYRGVGVRGEEACGRQQRASEDA